MSSLSYRRAILSVIILTICTYSSSPADQDSTQSEQETDSIVSLDKMIVTATRTKRLMSQTPASVSVISLEEIDVAPAKNIDDMLQFETGVQVKRVTGMGEGIPSDIIIRGIPGALSAARTLILVDGIPTNAAGTPFLILNEVPMDAIKNVEVVRGPYSSLYGANAFGGVVNILTKEGFGRPGIRAYFENSYPFTVLHKYAVNEKSIRTSLKESGSETYWHVGGTTSGGNEKVYYLVSGGYRTIGNYLLRDYAITKNLNDTIHKENENYDYRDIRFFGKCGVALNEKIDLELHARFFDSDLGFGKTKNIIPDSVDIITLGQKIIVGPRAKFYLNDNATILLKAYYRTLLGEFWNEESLPNGSYSPMYWKSRSHDWQIESQGIFSIGKAQIVTAGIEYLANYIHFGKKINPQTDSLIPNTYAVEEGISNFAFYMQDEISLFNRLNIIPGIRWDAQFNYDSTESTKHSIQKQYVAISPKFGVSYKIIDWLRFRSSVGRAFRAPTLSELYMPDLTIRPEFILRSNPALKPEKMWAVDGAFEITPLPVFKAQLGFFYNDMRNLIGQDADLGNLAVTHKNITKARSAGLEIELEGNISGWMNLFGNYVFQRSRNFSAGEVRKKFAEEEWKPYSGEDFILPLDYIPDHTFNLGIRLRKEIKNMVIEGTVYEAFTGKRSYFEWTEIDVMKDILPVFDDNGWEVYIDPPFITLQPYWRTDISLKCTLRDHIWFSINIQNLFDAVFEESAKTLSPGRFASITLGGEL